MTSIEYEDIYSVFLAKVLDNELASFDENTAFTMMQEWLHNGYSRPYVRRLFSSSTMDDDNEVFSYELEFANDSDSSSDMDFVIDVLSKTMVIEWLTPIVRSKVNLNQMFTGKEAKFFSQATHLAQLRNLLEDTELDLRKSIRDRGYIYNSYLED